MEQTENGWEISGEPDFALRTWTLRPKSVTVQAGEITVVQERGAPYPKITIGGETHLAIRKLTVTFEVGEPTKCTIDWLPGVPT